ncbi:MAG TPA: ferritin-like domain-containing protein [Bacteroidales bacterium]|nr:ferritin-like domain-containing protein [Bacteroidales bacterium]
MKTNTKKETGLIHELFEHQLQDIYWAEKEIDKFMPKIVGQVTSNELKQVFQEHMKVTKGQIKRLDNIFEIIGSKAKGEKCDGMEGLIKEAEKIVQEAEQGIVRDAFIIGAVQKVEHYEMASYGTLKALATIIGEFEVASLLGETLEEEKDADMNLTEVAENLVNVEAASESGELKDEEEEFEEIDEEEEEEDFEVEDEEDEEVEGRSQRSTQRSRSRK